MKTLSSRPAITIREGTREDLPILVAMLHESHKRMRYPFPVAYTVQLLQFALEFPVTHLLIVEDRIGLAGYCWAEVMLTGELLVHQVFLMPRRPPQRLHEAIMDLAREHDCRSIVGLTYRKGGVRGFGRWGFKSRAILLAKEVS